MHSRDDRTAAPTDPAPRSRRPTASIAVGVALLLVVGAVLHLTGVLPPG